MIKQIVTIGPLASGVANYWVASVTPSSGQSLTLAHTTAPSGIPQRVVLAYGDEAGARTLALTGTDRYGVTIKETLAVPASVSGGGTVTSVQDFATLTSAVAGGGAWTAAMTLGTGQTGSSPWQRVTEHVTPVNIGINVVISGTVNYTVETEDDPLDPHVDNTTAGPIFGPGGPVVPIVTPFAEPQSLTGQSTNQAGEITRPINAWRITLNSGSGSATATAIQGGIIQ